MSCYVSLVSVPKISLDFDSTRRIDFNTLFAWSKIDNSRQNVLEIEVSGVLLSPETYEEDVGEIFTKTRRSWRHDAPPHVFCTQTKSKTEKRENAPCCP